MFGDSDITLEDLTVVKLMEEIMELDSEIKLKQKFIQTRMTMLGKMLPSHPNKKTASVAQEFLIKLAKNDKPSVTYEQEAIPMRQADVHPQSIPLGQKDVIDEVIQMKDK